MTIVTKFEMHQRVEIIELGTKGTIKEISLLGANLSYRVGCFVNSKLEDVWMREEEIA